ncbi:MAG TPA: tripartite tricarboxylate transporter substrate binding protein [Burkholderiales bacterium]|jgi:putative tricarboxylic transport membrane protein|nr:tripartite tricarboxylate transporter substrate binding protein [Burkholderiales bacterium]
MKRIDSADNQHPRFLLVCKQLSMVLLLNWWIPGVPAQPEWRPSRNVEIIVQVGPGGSSDRTARQMQRILQENRLLETTITVVNKPGGGNVIAFNYLTQHAGDGHYWLINSVTQLTAYASGQSRLSYTEVSPLAMLFSEYAACAVRSDSQIKDGRTLLEILVKNPQAATIAISPGFGTPNHIALAMAVQAAGGDASKLKTVAFASSAETVAALLGGHVDVVVSPASTLQAHVIAGKLRAVAVSSPERLSGALANAPTWRELGAPAVFGNWRGAVGPKGLTDAQVSYWDEIFRRLVMTPDWKNYLDENMLTPLFLDGKESKKFIEAEYKKITEILKSIHFSK